MLIGLLFSANISLDLPERDRSPAVVEDVPAVCGDGIVSSGETSENCCVDVGCAEGYACSDNVCLLAGKEDAVAYTEFVLAGKNVISQAEAFRDDEQAALTRELFANQLQLLGEEGYQIAREQQAYDIITRHAEILYDIQDTTRRIQPVTASDIYLGVILNDGFSTPEQRSTLTGIGNSAVSMLSDIERFITTLENLDEQTTTYLETEFDLVIADVVEDYRIRQAYFDEIAVQIDDNGLIVYNSILD